MTWRLRGPAARCQLLWWMVKSIIRPDPRRFMISSGTGSYFPMYSFWALPPVWSGRYLCIFDLGRSAVQFTATPRNSFCVHVQLLNMRPFVMSSRSKENQAMVIPLIHSLCIVCCCNSWCGWIINTLHALTTFSLRTGRRICICIVILCMCV